MDPYIRDFPLPQIETFTLKDGHEANEILKINDNVNNFKILHLNIRSISKNLDELKIFLKGFDIKYDCIVLSETFQIFDTRLFAIEGYNLLYNNGKLNKNDGLVIYSRSDINYTYEIIDFNNTNIIQVKAEIEKKTNSHYSDI